MIEETQKIMDSKIEIFQHALEFGICWSWWISFCWNGKRDWFKKLITKIKKFPGLSLVDKKIDGGYVTPDESAGEDDVFVSRMRLGLSKKTLGLWIVADNLRKRSTLNSIQITELILKKK